jgi:hypothetical protein
MCRMFASCAVMLALLALPALAQSQSSASADQPAVPNQRYGRYRAPQTALCWKQAGISPEQVNQRWHIEDRGKARIAGVCSDASTSAEQKRAKIDEINAETDQEVANLIPANQLQAFKSCQAELDKKRPKTPGEKELGPCGGVISQSAPAASDHTHRP